MSLDFDFSAAKRDDGYVLVAKQYGVVVWARELISGIGELEARVKAVENALSEAGVEPDQLGDTVTSIRSRQTFFSELTPFLLKTIIATIFAGILFIMIAFAIFAAVSAPVSWFLSAAKHPAQIIVHLADKIDEAPPEKIDEWKLAIRKIVTKLSPIADEVLRSKSSQQVNGSKAGDPKHQ